MIACPICGAHRSTVLSTSSSAHHGLRERKCSRGHVFRTFEVHPTQLANARETAAALRKIERRVALYYRDAAIANDARPAAVVAQERGVSAARVRQIRAAMRAQVSPPSER